MENGKKVLFVCNKWPMLRMVYKRDRSMVIDGQVMREPQEYIGFIRTPYGGEFETDNADKIKFVRESPQFLDGMIVEVKDIEAIRKSAKAEDAHPLQLGVTGTIAREVHPVAPIQERQREVPAAVVPAHSAPAEEEPAVRPVPF